MAKFLVVYGTVQGQAGKIAKAICNELQVSGHLAASWNSKEIPASLMLSDYDAVIVGGGVHASGYPRSLHRWIASKARELSSKPGAFFSVCLGVLQNDPKVQADEQKIIDAFFRKTGWNPGTSVIFPGALTYSKYNWLLKRVMRAIARHAGVDTDLTHDYEYTNWNDVKHFARDFASRSVKTVM